MAGRANFSSNGRLQVVQVNVEDTGDGPLST